MATVDLSITSTTALNDGNRIPLLGFGVFRLEDEEECRKAIFTALEAGYRHIDTAAVYGNEDSVGRAIKAGGIPREELYLTTKCWIHDFGRQKTQDACRRSLDRLGMDYVDQYLIHWPIDETMMGAWEAMQLLREEGLCRSIGVSNFTVRRFEEFFFKHTDVVPSINQVELSPFLSRNELRDYCRSKGIQIESWAPLTRGEKLSHPAIVKLAEAYGKTPAQILLRWQLEHGIVTIPKSATPSRIRENADLFDFAISAEHLRQLDALDEGFSAMSWRPPPADQWY